MTKSEFVSECEKAASEAYDAANKRGIFGDAARNAAVTHYKIRETELAPSVVFESCNCNPTGVKLLKMAQVIGILGISKASLYAKMARGGVP